MLGWVGGFLGFSFCDRLAENTPGLVVRGCFRVYNYVLELVQGLYTIWYLD